MLKGLFSRNLSFKVAIIVVAVLTVLGGGSFAYVYFKIQRQLIEAQEREALTLATALESSLAGAMLAEIAVKDPGAIQSIFESVGDQRKEIKKIYMCMGMMAERHLQIIQQNVELLLSGIKRSSVLSATG